MFRLRLFEIGVAIACIDFSSARAATVAFFNSSQIATPVAAGVTSDTISSNGYLFTYTRDKLFTGGVGMTEPIGRPVRVSWPAGVEAQAVTTPPPGVTDYKARFTLTRVDGDKFDLTAFTAKLLANTAGAGGAIEIMPSLNGEDGFNDPLYFDATGYSGSTFSYNTLPNYLGSTALLKGFDRYTINLYVDFALTALTLEGAPIVLSGDFDFDGDVDGEDLLMWQRGESPNGLGAADLAAWQGNFGSLVQHAGASASVPEPSAAASLALASIGWKLGTRRRNRQASHLSPASVNGSFRG